LPQLKDKLTKDFFGQARAEWDADQKELQARLLQATRMNQGRQPQEVLDDFIRANTAQQNVIRQEMASLGSVDISPDMARRRRALNLEMAQLKAQESAMRAKALQMLGVQNTPAPPVQGDPVSVAKAALASGKITKADVKSSARLTPQQKAEVLGITVADLEKMK